MPVMDAQSLLVCWERGRSRHPLDRAVLLHAAAVPSQDADSLPDRPLGERNAALLRLHEQLAGDALQSSVDCPECHERLEFALSSSTLRARAVAAPPHVRVGDVTVRVPTTRDLASIANEPDEAVAARTLLQRLISQEVVAEHSFDAPTLDQLTRALEDADPCADLTVDSTCPACGHAWNAPLDVAAFLWEEIDVRARRLLDEVHVLAHAYGWTEREILRLSDARRGAYLERVLA